jgi:MoaA/NifB/PqqE/SkfB family radical SAM enzyme
MESVRPWPEVQADIDAAKARGNEWIDITGGEPMLYPQIAELVRYAHGGGLGVRIITSCIAPRATLEAVLEAGVDDWLVSMHGMAETHDRLVGHRGARQQQEQWLACMTRSCVNFVIAKANQGEIAAFAQYVRQWSPRIVNFINFNPHHQWKHNAESRKFVADLRIVEPQLSEAVDTLEAAGSGVNVRYYPTCRIREDLRRCVCNDLHVAFDSGEWDYDLPKTFDAHRAWGIKTSNCTEEKGPPCSECGLHGVCGGANRYWHTVATELYGECLTPQELPAEAGPDDFYFYRRSNATGMA